MSKFPKMRPQLPLLPIPTTGFLPSKPPTSLQPIPISSHMNNLSIPISPRRPPTLPPRSAPTWRSILVRSTAPRLRADVVGVALLAAEAKRRGGLMVRERRQVGIQGDLASPLLRRRVNLLERDVHALMRTVARAKARVRAHMKASASGNSSPRSVISKR